MRKVAAVVVTYNRLMLLKECIESLKNQALELSHIIIVNNNSSDGTTNYLKTLKDDTQIRVVNLKENLGGAGGFNAGLKFGIEHTHDDYFWIMDDDTIPDDDALKSLINRAEFLKDDFGYLCSNVRWIDGSPSNLPKVASGWTQLLQHDLIKVTEATFVSVLTTRKNILNVGYPIADIFIWGDDTEYTLRLSRMKVSYLVEDSTVLHKSKQRTAGLTLVSDDSERLQRYFYLIRNVMYINRKYHNTGIIRLVASHVVLANKILLRSKNRKLMRIGILVKGFVAGMRFNPNIESVKNED
ncbi:glycosyltransferase [Lactiplantibacillus paraxiangfangensis]|uniref:glycosyltransferase n=1 Tax=Lactiplantibacillus paraxiangfangensis TaxID=3076224 RepID=UPI0030C692AE